MDKTSLQKAAVTCAKRIATLNLLNQCRNVIPKPFKNPETHLQRKWSGYTLPFEAERKLACALAILASTNPKTDIPTALCLQEATQTSSLNVLVSINKVNADSVQPYLGCLRTRFETLFSLLAEAKGPL